MATMHTRAHRRRPAHLVGAVRPLRALRLLGTPLQHLFLLAWTEVYHDRPTIVKLHQINAYYKAIYTFVRAQIKKMIKELKSWYGVLAL